MSINFALEIPNSPYVDTEEFKKKVAEYAQTLFMRMSAQGASTARKMKPFQQLDPMLQELSGICFVAEDDLNGDEARQKALNTI